MTKYEKLLDVIDGSDIIYSQTDADMLPACTIRIENEYGILFNEDVFETNAERYINLAHEKAHCDTGAVYSAYAPLISREYCEARAWRRTIQDVMPFDEMVEVFERCVYADGLDVFELADKLDVTPEFAKRAIEHYHRRGERW